jgi:alpha-L-fucosidase
MAKHGDTIRLSDQCQPRRGNYVSYTRKGNTLYAHVYYWPGETVVIANLLNKVSAVTMHGSNTPVKFVQDDWRVRLTGLPKRAPELVTTFALECDGEPRQNHEGKRAEKTREVKYQS